jgi:hypothetical protein
MPAFADWNDLLAAQLKPGQTCQLKVNGNSMLPTLRFGDRITVRAEPQADLKIGDLAVFRLGEFFVIHRLVERRSPDLIFKGDARWLCDPPVSPQDVLGRVITVERLGKQWSGRRWSDPLVAILSRGTGYLYSKMRSWKQIILRRKSL